MYEGFADQGSPMTLLFQLLDSSGNVCVPDAAPSYRIYAATGIVAAGSGNAAAFETGSVTGATNASPIVITSAAHGISTGQAITISGVGGNTNANGNYIATAIDTNTFSLNGTTGNSAYTGGGTWSTTGLYAVTLSGSVLNSLQAGVTYTCILTWTLSGVEKAIQATFTVR